jgi:transposase InsO family protein
METARQLDISPKTLHTRKKAKHNIFEYIETFYNYKRIHSANGYISTMTYEKQYQQGQLNPLYRVKG